MSPSGPGAALHRLAGLRLDEGTLVSEHVIEPTAEPVLGPLAAAGPRAASAPEEYSFVIESVLEGYLLHYGVPRVLAGLDPDLALLAGDYLYAQGIERLADLGDVAAVAELSDLISLAAEAVAEARGDLTEPLWLATSVAVGCGPSPALVAAKLAAQSLEESAGHDLRAAASARAADAGLSPSFDLAADSIDFRLPELDTRG